MTTIIMNENNTDVLYDSFPSGVTTQYKSKEGQLLSPPVKLEFNTLASFLLWAMSTYSSFVSGSEEAYNFAYFVATRPPNQPIECETQYVRRIYTFVTE